MATSEIADLSFMIATFILPEYAVLAAIVKHID